MMNMMRQQQMMMQNMQNQNNMNMNNLNNMSNTNSINTNNMNNPNTIMTNMGQTSQPMPMINPTPVEGNSNQIPIQNNMQQQQIQKPLMNQINQQQNMSQMGQMGQMNIPHQQNKPQQPPMVINVYSFKPNQPQGGNIPPMNNMNNMMNPRPYMFPGQGNQFPRMVNPPQNMFNPNQFQPQQQQQQALPQQNNQLKDMILEAMTKLSSNTNQPDTLNKPEDKNDLSSIGGEDEENVFERDFSLEEENLKNFWGGFLTKNKKDRVCVDAYQIRNEVSEWLSNEYNLNVSHRTQYEEIMKRPMLGIIAFSPQNETQCDIFLEYISYFNEKQRVGVINLKSQAILYIVPPCEFSRKFYQNPKKHLLGILVNSAIEPKTFVDMNNLVLPPPVISSAEKKLIKMQKRSQTTQVNPPNPVTNQSQTQSQNQSQIQSQNQVQENNNLMSELQKIVGLLDSEKLGK
jgi:hypothetical protein